MYSTAWTLHCSLRPIEWPHSGQGNAVLFLSTSGSPDEVQMSALRGIDVHQWRAELHPPFSVDRGQRSQQPCSRL